MRPQASTFHRHFVELRPVFCILISLAIIFTIVAVSTDKWMGGNLINKMGIYSNTSKAVFGLLVSGAICLTLALLCSLLTLFIDRHMGALIGGFYANLFLGAILLFTGLCIYTGNVTQYWSNASAVTGCVLALEVAISAGFFCIYDRWCSR